MIYEINGNGLKFIQKLNGDTKFGLFISLPLFFLIFGVGVFFRCDNHIIGIFASVILLIYPIYIFVYVALVPKGKMINSIVTSIEIIETEFRLYTASSTLYPSQKIAGPLTGLIKIGNGADFIKYERATFKCDGAVSGSIYIIKEFFDDYDMLITKNITHERA